MVRAGDEVRYGPLSGANVTMPHKQLAFELADRVSEAALRSGAVNTLVGRDGEVWGHNTDVDGIRAVWSSASLPTDRPVLILGTGGAAAGVVVGVIANRQKETADRRCQFIFRTVCSVRSQEKAGVIDQAVQPAPGRSVVEQSVPVGFLA